MQGMLARASDRAEPGFHESCRFLMKGDGSPPAWHAYLSGWVRGDSDRHAD